jgi:DNA repair protein RecO (recombination protein O)
MDFYTAKGIVIREVEFNEADKILTILTDNLGLITAKASGIKSMKRKELSGAKLFIYGDYILTKKGDFYNLKECNIITFFSNIKNDLESLSLGYYILEIAGNMAIEDEFDCNILRLTLNALFALNQNKINQKILKAAFEMKIACEIGYEPQIKQQEEISTSINTYFFDLLNGIIIQDNNQSDMNKNMISLSAPTVKAIQYIISADIKNYLSFNLKDGYIKEFSDICEKFFLLHSGFSPKSLDYLKKITEF